MKSRGLTYRDAGVDIKRGEAFVERIRRRAEATFGPEVLGGLGGFGAAFRLDAGHLDDPVLVSGTDGVGTKLLIAQAVGRHDTVGIDLVAMCVNDILTVGARPIFFLDYLATGCLEPEVLASVVDGIAAGCEAAGCALIGGETAEMPSLYEPGVYDLAGFSVGLVDRSAMLGPHRVEAGDVLVGVASSGVHSNGLSLVRHLVSERGYPWDHAPGALGRPLAEVLLEPTRIYVRAVHHIMEELPVHAMAHITGGGIPGNLVRALPDGLQAIVRLADVPRLPVFTWLEAEGVAPEEMARVFNLGLGLALIVPPEAADQAVVMLRRSGQEAWQIGGVREGQRAVHVERG